MDWMEKRGMNMSTSKHAVRLDLISEKGRRIDMAESYSSGLADIAKGHANNLWSSFKQLLPGENGKQGHFSLRKDERTELLLGVLLFSRMV